MPISVRLCSANEILHANRCQAQLWKRPARLGAAFPRVSDRFFFYYSYVGRRSLSRGVFRVIGPKPDFCSQRDPETNTGNETFNPQKNKNLKKKPPRRKRPALQTKNYATTMYGFFAENR